ncbi:hypothetical protein [Euzebya tangerina]|uniref:hypothetical protein n=1 Tax=Euzebya tangerina TaxID=591198 RepID=UPI0013C2D6EF|nr:hypothetical protein [Euzebya tangerina]
MTRSNADSVGMANNAPTRTLSEELRARRVAGQLQRKRNGTTTRNYHRFRRVQSIAFYVTLVLIVAGVASLMVS